MSHIHDRTMRLTEFEKEIIINCTKNTFGEKSRVIVFGSRTNDNKKGGDIDLLVIPGIQASSKETLRKKIQLLIEIENRLGEQSIDILIKYPKDNRKIITTASKTGTAIC